MVVTIASSLPKAATATSPQRDHVKAEARELLMAINGVGNSCGAVTRVLLRGVDREKPAVYWSAACSNGANYQLRVTIDRVRVADCALLKLGPTECFSTLTASAILLDEKNTTFREATRPE
jgi:hypothetical protein